MKCRNCGNVIQEGIKIVKLRVKIDTNVPMLEKPKEVEAEEPIEEVECYECFINFVKSNL